MIDRTIYYNTRVHAMLRSYSRQRPTVFDARIRHKAGKLLPPQPGSNDRILLCSTGIRSICNDFYWIMKKIHTSSGRLGDKRIFHLCGGGPNVISVLHVFRILVLSATRKTHANNTRARTHIRQYCSWNVLSSSSSSEILCRDISVYSVNRGLGISILSKHSTS